MTTDTVPPQSGVSWDTPDAAVWELVLLSRNAIYRIADLQDQVLIWQNLALCLADRLAARAAGI